jgi:hypothetical protein
VSRTPGRGQQLGWTRLGEEPTVRAPWGRAPEEHTCVEWVRMLD